MNRIKLQKFRIGDTWSVRANSLPNSLYRKNFLAWNGYVEFSDSNHIVLRRLFVPSKASWSVRMTCGHFVSGRQVRLCSQSGSDAKVKFIPSKASWSVRMTCGHFVSGRQVRLCSQSGSDPVNKVSIGNVSYEVLKSKNPEYIPVGYLPTKQGQTLLRHLKWMMQKDALGQDMFLIGPPGPLKRLLAMMYLEMTGQEAEYISLSRDTTETDLKQRREIQDGTAYHIDQCAVRAAIEGRVLVLEGIEKVERNVLPVLNNLLENREMQLDDGRFLMHPNRYDKLLEDHSKEELDAWKLVRVHEKFRVVALGLPVPKYQGNPLDPPLRSRFQSRDIHPVPFKDLLEELCSIAPNVIPERIAQVLSFATTMLTEESKTLGLPDFPVDNLRSLVGIMEAMPGANESELVTRLYPYGTMLNKEGKDAVQEMLKTFELQPSSPSAGRITDIRYHDDHARASVDVQTWRGKSSINVPCGTQISSSSGSRDFVQTDYHNSMLCDMMASHLVSDFCIIGPRGCGKTSLVSKFADLLNYHVELIMLYQDMTSRDLLLQRTTMPNGNTIWRKSALVKAALDGNLAVLDGVHRVNAGTFAVLQRLIHDRELTLFDGTRLIRHERYDQIRQRLNLTESEMLKRGIYRIHPSFRIVALAEPPGIGSSAAQWLTPELLTMFLYHDMRALSYSEDSQLLSQRYPAAMERLGPILELTHRLRQMSDNLMTSLSSSMTTRQLLRIGHRLSEYQHESLHHSVQKACLARFLPRMARAGLEQILNDVGIKKPAVKASVDDIERASTSRVLDGRLRIGNTECDVYVADSKMKIPDVVFYDNVQHLTIMEDMLKDYLLGEHLLLIGNQGVGKNKIVDRFLYLLNRPREYLQLHRDTTVQSLTLQPSVHGGVIVYEDSALVRAVKFGHILVIDEADKAPTNVTCILKTLVESGEMHLADGRRIVPVTSQLGDHPDIIRTHPDFRMIVLANRPGFPFLGNDFFGAMGDLFSCHAVDNPDTESELAMLREYGPSVPEHVLRKLIAMFSELRFMADQGMINYPYSTREVVNMVKHLEKYPDEGLVNIVKNVFDFDSYNKEMYEVIVETLHKHGIPYGAHPGNVKMATEFPLPNMVLTSTWTAANQEAGRTSPFLCPVEKRPVKFKGPTDLSVEVLPLEKVAARSSVFSEQAWHWMLPLHENNIIVDVVVTKAAQRVTEAEPSDLVHVVTASPLSVYTMDMKTDKIRCLDLYDAFPRIRGTQRPQLSVASLGAPLEHCIMIHEGMSGILVQIDTSTGGVTRVNNSSMLETATNFIQNFSKEKSREMSKMCTDLACRPEATLAFYTPKGQSIDVLNVTEGTSFTISLPVSIADLRMASPDRWIVTEHGTEKKFFLIRGGDNMQFSLAPVTETGTVVSVTSLASHSADDQTLSAIVSQKISCPNRSFSGKNVYAGVIIGFPDLESPYDIYTIPRDPHPEKRTKVSYSFYTAPQGEPKQQTVHLKEGGLVVSAVPDWKVPEEIHAGVVNSKENVSGYLEVVDPINKRVRYVPVPGPSRSANYLSWIQSITESGLHLVALSDDRLLTIDYSSCARIWEATHMQLDKALGEWRQLIGEQERLNLELTSDTKGNAVTEPKHGREDPENMPHVGGSTWAGGVGGRDTAGLGGVGGPYRLDAGHDVYQVSDEAKAAVPLHVQQAARDMARKAFKERLREIKMSEHDGELYEQLSKSVRKQVKALRIILDSLQAKSKERQWLRHQTDGDLDEAKLIEGIAGEKSIYRRRAEKEPELGTPQQKPKRLSLLVDVSGSMYRFNGYDKRLEREMEAVLMLMEAFENYEDKLKFDVIGHSGDDYDEPIVVADKIPKNNKERLDVLKTMHAHSQFCMSGDHTLQATRSAIKKLAQEEADERFVIVLSDANLDRYGIPAKRFAEALEADENVNAYAIFIGSLGNQADRLAKALPSGKSFVCLDTKNIPQILQQIFQSTVLK